VVQRFPLPKPVVEMGKRTGTVQGALKGHRKALFNIETGYVEIPIYDRYRLPVGGELSGPAVVEQEDTTTVVYPGHDLKVDEYNNMIIWVPKD
jgi:N-methylhydantoinase A